MNILQYIEIKEQSYFWIFCKNGYFRRIYILRLLSLFFRF